MSNQFQFALVFRADVASGKAGLSDLATTFNQVSTAGDKVSATARKQANDLEALAAATARAVSGQDQLAAAEKRAADARARSLIAPLANPTPAMAPMQAAFRQTQTAVGGVQSAVAGLTVSFAAQAQEAVEVANATRVYQSALDDVRASFNPLFAASRAYEQQLERIADAEKLGAINAREAAAARAAAAERLAPGMQPGQRAARPNGGYTSNIGAQGFDIGVTAAMGMNPLMIGLQQGSQLAGIAQDLGGGTKAAKGLAAGLLSIVNPTSLVTIGLVALGAAGIQWLISLQKKTLTLDEAMGQLKTTMSEYKDAAREAASSSSTLEQRFGADTAAARELYQELEKLKRAQALDIAGEAFGAATDGMGLKLGGAASGFGADLKILSKSFGLDMGEDLEREAASAVRRAMVAFDSARFEIDPTKRLDRMAEAMGPLIDQTVAAIDFDGKRTDDEEALLQVLLEQNVALLEQKALLDGSAQSAVARQQVDQIVLGYRQEVELAAAILATGEDSLAVERLRGNHARELLEIKLEQMGIEKNSDDAARARDALAEQLAARERAIIEVKRQANLDQMAAIDAVRREVALIGASNAERLRANALAEAEIEIQKRKLGWLEAILFRQRAITKAGEEARLDREKALSDIANGSLMDGFDARIARERNPYIRAEIEAEKEYASQIAAGNDETVAAAAANRVRAKSLSDVAREQEDLLRGQAEGLQQLQLELALVGQTAEVRTRVLALAQAERDIQRTGLQGDQAEQYRRQATAQAELTRQIEASADAWGRVQSAGENAVDAVLDKLREGDIAGAFEELAAEIEKGFFDLAIRNPLKNALFGTNLGTMQDVGGLGGIWSKLMGRNGVDEAGLISQAVAPVGTMSVMATTVIIGGAGAQAFLSGMSGPGMTGPGGSAGFGGANGGGNWAGALGGSGDVQSTMWSFFAAKGLKPHQIAAIMGNANAESAFNPLAKGDKINGQYTSFGLFQHHKGRADGLLAETGGMEGLGNVNAQLDYVWKELMTSENGAFKKLMASTNVQEATAAFVGYERPQGWTAANPMGAHNWEGRLGAAEAALAKFGTTATDATMNLGTLGSGFDIFGNALAQGLQGAASGGTQGGLMGFLGPLLTGLAGSLGIPGFATGGDHRGGLRIVGENGPELEATGASRIFNAAQTREILAPRAAMPTPANQTSAPAINIVQTFEDHSSGGVSIRTEETTDARGQRQQKFIMSDAVGQGLATPGGKGMRTMREAYGVKRPGRVRG
jgi:hypothetical protein